MKYAGIFNEMERSILEVLTKLEPGYGYRKWAISEKTEIPEDILTVLLKRLKYAGKIELIMIWSETTGMPDGSGYCLTGSLQREFQPPNKENTQLRN
ncbi:hypothetical protein [Flagellimonas flava]|uniref:hypothetical protein n=1 Tax=Flagellimonas flava TaxID=570519 RepID=UPI003D6483B6